MAEACSDDFRTEKFVIRRTKKKKKINKKSAQRKRSTSHGSFPLLRNGNSIK